MRVETELLVYIYFTKTKEGSIGRALGKDMFVMMQRGENMIGTCGNEKASDCIVTVDLNHTAGIEVEIISKLKYMYGELMEKAVRESLAELKVENAKVELQDFGALDFIIKARTKTATKRAQRGGNN